MEINKPEIAGNYKNPVNSPVSQSINEQKKEQSSGVQPSSGESIKLSHEARKSIKGNKGKTTHKEAPITQSGPAPALPMPKAKWTVLAYMAGDNDLESFVTNNLIDMEKVGSSKDVNIVAQLDRGPDPTPAKGGEKDAARYYIMKDNDPKHINSPVMQKLGPADMGAPGTLKDFLSWGMKNYPAQNYLIILNDHGGGFTGALEDQTNNSFMSVPDMKKAIAGAEKDTGVDKEQVTVGFDACLMAQGEVGYELKDVAKTLLASEEVIGGTGWPYTGILASGKTINGINKFVDTEKKLSNAGKNPVSIKEDNSKIIGNMNPQQVSKFIIDECAKAKDSTVTMSAANLDKIGAFKDALNGFAKALLKTDVPDSVIKNDFKASQHYTVGMEMPPYADVRDAYDLAKHIVEDRQINDANLKDAAKALMASVEEVVFAEEHVGDGMEGSHGISIYAPIKKGGLDGYHYDKLALAKDTNWEEALEKFTGKPTNAAAKPQSGFKPPRPKNGKDVKEA
ncbi:MAG: clostripain-related cysteine peptidase [Firmicutes bacterium]|nr:clostripain-related cysteine peptidase [Bacillota bacterium]